MLTIGIPKGENLLGKVERLFAEAGIPMSRESEDSYRLQFPGSTMFAGGFLLRTRRVPILVMREHVDLGIVGEDAFEECRSDAKILLKLWCKRLGLDRTRVTLFAAKDDPVSRLEDIPPNARIISEYPELTRRQLVKRTDVTIDSSPGGCEAEVPLAYRFGVAVVDTGKTLEANGLKAVRSVFSSVPLLVGNRSALQNASKARAAHQFVATLRRVLD